MLNKCTIWIHAIVLVTEVVVLETLAFERVLVHVKYADRVYTSQSNEMSFSIASGQDEGIGSMAYYRVDYTLKADSMAEMDTGFKENQMIKVVKDKTNPYKEYRVSLPKNVLRVSVNFHPLSARSEPALLKLASMKIGSHELDLSKLSPYRNEVWNFKGWTYVPNLFMRGYYVEYFVLVGMTVVMVLALSVWYFRKRGMNKFEEC